MTDQLPDPLVPAEVDLRGFEFMPLFGDRLFKSETWIAASADARVAMLKLWWHSYSHEMPAASLPDNDQLLADYAGYGVMVKGWMKVKKQAMRGYVLCSDGRWYHPIVAQLAMDGWKERVRNREKQRAWRERNHRKDGDVTVTKQGTQPLRNAGQGQGQGQGQGEGQGEVNLKPHSDQPASGRASPSPAAKPPAQRGKRLPADWVLPKAWGDWALGQRPEWSAETVRLVAEKFRDHWVSKAGAMALKIDWQATWRNWVRNEPEGKINGKQAHRGVDFAAFTGESGPPAERDVIDGESIRVAG